MLSVQGLAYVRDQELIFSGLTFSVNPGTILQIKGANGAGKSSLLRILAGLCSTFVGSLHCSVSKLYMGHQMGLHPDLSPVQNLVWLMRLQGAVDRLAIDRALERLGLAAKAHTPCKMLSKGQSQRVGLAALMLRSAKLWILDEPCTGLDAAGVQILEELLGVQLASGGGVVLASHQDCLRGSFETGSITLDRLEGPKVQNDA